MKKSWQNIAISVLLVIATILYIEVTVQPTYVHKFDLYTLEYIIYNYLPLFFLLVTLVLIINRIISATLISAIIYLLIVVVNNVKYLTLQSTLIAYDFQLFNQVKDSVGLYTKYIPWYSFVLLAFVFAAAVVVVREKRFFDNNLKYIFMRIASVSVIIALALSGHYKVLVSKLYNPSLLQYIVSNPEATVAKSGLFFSLVKTSLELKFEIPSDYGNRETFERLTADEIRKYQAFSLPKELPDIVVVQSEGFYDFRKLDIKIDPDPYKYLDAVSSKARFKGQITVPIYGGNTLIPEFSFLTGIPTSILPKECRYPYRSLVNHNMWSIARYLKTIGYKTIVIHPYSRTFWNRNVAMPYLGFDDFIDIRSFTDSDKEGSYVSDKALLNKVTSTINSVKSPVFLFEITVENHGPWDSKRVERQRQVKITAPVSDGEKERLGRYAHHLINADNMLGELTAKIKMRSYPTIAAFYGDHAPAFNELFKKSNDKHRDKYMYQTPYFIWSNKSNKQSTTKNVDVSFLAAMILDEAGVNKDKFFITNSIFKDRVNGNFDIDELSSPTDKSYIQLLYETIRAGNIACEIH